MDGSWRSLSKCSASWQRPVPRVLRTCLVAACAALLVIEQHLQSGSRTASGAGRTVVLPARLHVRRGWSRRVQVLVGRQLPWKPWEALARPAKDQEAEPRTTFAFMPLSTLFVVLLVVHRCVVDGLSRYTRLSDIPYSATTAAFLGECCKAPVLLGSLFIFEGRKKSAQAFKVALEEPFSMAIPALCYSIQNVLYFLALSHISVASYQILSQTKLLFTAMLMSTMMGKGLTKKQVVALGLLVAGTCFTQLSELPRSKVVGGSATWGGFLTIISAILSSYPNVYIEKVVKRDQNQWACNLQTTFWIWFWLVVFSVPSFFRSVGVGGGPATGLSGLLTGFNGWVWLVIWLQSLKCILVPATLRHADNILYATVKPLSIVLVAAVAAGVSGILPNARFVVGGSLVIASMLLY